MTDYAAYSVTTVEDRGDSTYEQDFNRTAGVLNTLVTGLPESVSEDIIRTEPILPRREP